MSDQQLDQQLDRILADQRLAREILARIGKGEEQRESLESTLSPAARLRSRMRGQPGLEKIIRAIGRPVLTVKDGTFAQTDVERWRSRLETARQQIEKAIRSVGRVELRNDPDYQWAGTAWVIGEDLVVTNRHVGEIFARRDGTQFVFRRKGGGVLVSASIDFRREHESEETFEIPVASVVYLAPDRDDAPDVALLRLERRENTPPAIRLAPDMIDEGREVAVIGYPAYDYDEDDQLQQDLFGYYEVKRLAPGEVMGPETSITFKHDCSTLGGNSGSVVLDLDSGAAIGLHYSGRSGKANYAVRASVVDAIIKAAQTATIVSPRPDVSKSRVHSAEALADRTGYDAEFLGQPVPIPALSDAVAADFAGRVDYTHFSVAMSRSRRLALFTAVNIDGHQLRRIVRKGDAWFLDGRLPLDVQFGDELYSRNKLDRGHLVRRLDPVWGDQAELADADTFHFTNAAPQHEGLNQKTWLALEDYVLESAETHDLRVSVFTGPVFRDTDREYRDAKIPEEFWKVVTTVSDGALVATAYLLTQRHLLTDIEFVFGPFRTYQVPVKAIEKLTSLDFGQLRDRDPLATTAEAPGRVARVIDGPEDLTLRLDPEALTKELQSLKSDRRFPEMVALADRTNAYQSKRPLVRKLAIQALIDTGQLDRAIGELHKTREYIETTLAAHGAQLVPDVIVRVQLRPELAEVQGLLGRVYKQRCVDAAGSGGDPAARVDDARQSMQYYVEAYDAAPVENLWHGVNFVAVAHYARKHLQVTPPRAPENVAREMLQTLDYLDTQGMLTVWDHATRGELALSLGDRDLARAGYQRCVAHGSCDAFVKGSARRQLMEVWELDPADPLVRILSDDPPPTPATPPAAPAQKVELQSRTGGEYVMPDDDPNARIYAYGVARLGDIVEGDGTGFLFDGDDISPSLKGKRLLLTAAHVVPDARTARKMWIAFLGAPDNPEKRVLLQFAELLWTSPVEDLDASLLALHAGPDHAKPAQRADTEVTVGDNAFIVGHPFGGVKIVSAQPKFQVREVEDKRFYYDTSTDKGMSGGPVFNDKWQVTGIHCFGYGEKQLNGGSRLDRIVKALKEHFARER